MADERAESHGYPQPRTPCPKKRLNGLLTAGRCNIDEWLLMAPSSGVRLWLSVSAAEVKPTVMPMLS